MSGGGDNVGVGEGRGNDARRHQAADVGHVRHQQRSATVGDLPEPGVVEVARVAADSGDDQLRFEEQGVSRQLVIVDQPSLGVYLIVDKDKVKRSVSNCWMQCCSNFVW